MQHSSRILVMSYITDIHAMSRILLEQCIYAKQVMCFGFKNVFVVFENIHGRTALSNIGRAEIIIYMAVPLSQT